MFNFYSQSFFLRLLAYSLGHFSDHEVKAIILSLRMCAYSSAKMHFVKQKKSTYYRIICITERSPHAYTDKHTHTQSYTCTSSDVLHMVKTHGEFQVIVLEGLGGKKLANSSRQKPEQE